MHVSVKSNHLAKANARAEVAKSPYIVNVPSAADLKKQTRNNNKNANAPPLTNIERLKRREQRKGKSAGLKAEVAALRRTVRARCNELADMYDKKPRYVMDMFYQRSHLAAKNTYEVNPFNAYKSVVAHERREAGETPLHLLELQSTIAQDYKDLDDAALEKVVEKYRELRDEDKREKLKRPSMKEKIADVARSVDDVMTTIQGLKTHCGIEFVGLLVKNRPEPFMNPKWLATDGRIHDYLSLILRGWDPTYIGKKVEAFAVAGCDATKIFKSQKDQGEALKRHLVRIVQDGLDQTCGTENQVMQYERFDTTITMRYKVVVEGWPKGIPFQKPSAFGGALEPLVRLRNAWQTGEAHFRKLSDDEFQTWLAQRVEKIEKGDIVPKARKKRSDAGVKRGGKANGKEKASGGEDDGEESESGEKDTHGEESDSGGKGRDTELKEVERPAKKAKTSASTKTKPAKPRGAKKSRTMHRKPSRPSDDVDEDPDTNSGPSDTSPPARTVPAPSASPTEPLPKPRPQPRPVVPRKSAKPLEPTDGEQDGGEGSSSAPVAPTDGVDSTINTPRGAPEAVPDDHQAPSMEPRVAFDDALIDPSLRSVHVPPLIPETELTATSERSSPPVRPSSPAPNVSRSKEEKRKRKSEEARLLEDAEEHGMNDEKRSRVVVRKRHLGAGSFNPKTRGEGVNSDDEGFESFHLC
ncbi:hypothetical protein V5O48_014784 [Marasmius crinis-equi]|uniref:Uncharacterized protein n=1 Tax=Marasmius crinis-equi TaxID=585013 RepID=A0ABR3EWD3_9AGAR